jgi:ATP-dependent helicase HrpB
LIDKYSGKLVKHMTNSKLTDSTRTPLPIDSIIDDLKRTVSNSTNVVLQAPPGAGKTTRVPLALLELPLLDTGRIIMLEPRRLAASHAAHRMAKSLGERAGETIGYTMRFERRVSEGTRIEVVTEGVLTRRLQNDPCLEGTTMVIFDEFHERSLQADLALALCLEVQREVRPDLRILVMSATLDGRSVATLLGDAPVITSTGRSFPVEVLYLENKGHAQLPVRMRDAIRRAMSETEGDILAFLPGSPEIRACSTLLADEMVGSAVSVCPLYGDLPFHEQEKAVQPSSLRKVVLATNIAETSLTIEGVRVVIDSGLSRMVRHDPANGMNRLVTVRESRASAEQRKGRAGRLAPGVCYRLFGMHTFDAMTAFSPPEITVSDLAPLVLELAAWGVQDPASLSWLDAPPVAGVAAAKELLFDLGAIDRNGLPTETGRRMAEFPVHPRLARMLIRGMELGLAGAASSLAALLTERDIFRHGPGETGPVCESDLFERYEVLNGRQRRPGLMFHDAAVRAVERAASQLVRLTGKSAKMRHVSSPERLTIENGRKLDAEDAARLLLAAYPDRIARQREQGSDRYLLANGRGAHISQKSGVRNRPLILAVHVDAGEKGEGVIHQACELSEDLVRMECGGRIVKEKRVFWDTGQARVLALVEEAVGAAVLVRRQTAVSDDEAVPFLLTIIRDSDMECLGWDGAPRQFLGRVRLIRQAFPEEIWPDMGKERLLETLPHWLGPFLTGTRSKRDFASVELLSALKACLSWEQQRLLDERAPTHIVVPSGSRIGIDYESDDGPVLAVKLQEMFGLCDTPTIAGERVKLLLHLLSPARRPVQVTRDLKGFWENGYSEVKRELKGRYPKHPWPDDPWNAVPTRMTNRMLKNRE